MFTRRIILSTSLAPANVFALAGRCPRGQDWKAKLPRAGDGRRSLPRTHRGVTER